LSAGKRIAGFNAPHITPCMPNSMVLKKKISQKSGNAEEQGDYLFQIPDSRQYLFGATILENRHSKT
jgi:hypothetical protein